MNPLTKNWRSRMVVISVIMIATCLLFYLLDSTNWANDIRLTDFGSEDGEGEFDAMNGEEYSALLIFVASVLKVIFSIGIPMALAVGIGGMYNFSKRQLAKLFG